MYLAGQLGQRHTHCVGHGGLARVNLPVLVIAPSANDRLRDGAHRSSARAADQDRHSLLITHVRNHRLTSNDTAGLSDSTGMEDNLIGYARVSEPKL